MLFLNFEERCPNDNDNNNNNKNKNNNNNSNNKISSDMGSVPDLKCIFSDSVGNKHQPAPLWHF